MFLTILHLIKMYTPTIKQKLDHLVNITKLCISEYNIPCEVKNNTIITPNFLAICRIEKDKYKVFIDRFFNKKSKHLSKIILELLLNPSFTTGLKYREAFDSVIKIFLSYTCSVFKQSGIKLLKYHSIFDNYTDQYHITITIPKKKHLFNLPANFIHFNIHQSPDHFISWHPANKLMLTEDKAHAKECYNTTDLFENPFNLNIFTALYKCLKYNKMRCLKVLMLSEIVVLNYLCGDLFNQIVKSIFCNWFSAECEIF